MALSKILDNVSIISTLATDPNSTTDVEVADLKEKFDEAPNILKDFINDTLTTEIDNEFEEAATTYATKTEVQGITLGQIPDGTITQPKLSTDLQDKINNAGGVTDQYYTAVGTDVNTGTTTATVQTDYVPMMTGNTTGSFVSSGGGVSSTTNYNQYYYAFDKNASTAWKSNVNSTGMLKIKFDTALIVTSYTIFSSDGGNYVPSSWTLEGSNDGSSWTIVHTVTGYALGSPIANSPTSQTTPYLYYRINITATIGGSYPPTIHALTFDVKKDVPVYKTQYTVSEAKYTEYINNTKILIKPDKNEYVPIPATTEKTNSEININSLGHKKVYGTSLRQGNFYDLVYDSTLDGFVASNTNLVGSLILPTPSPSFTISGLDINRDGGMYEIVLNGTTSAGTSISMYINGDTTATNYYNGTTINGTVNSSNAAGISSTTNANAALSSIISLKLSGDKALAVSNAQEHVATGVFYRSSVWENKNTQSNITSITFSAFSGNINAGAIVKIYKR